MKQIIFTNICNGYSGFAQCYAYSSTGEKLCSEYLLKFPHMHEPLISPLSSDVYVSVNNRDDFGEPIGPGLRDSLMFRPDSVIAEEEYMMIYGVHRIDYSGDIIYENIKPVPNCILFDGGYITFSNKQPVYHFYLTDHQGNVRVVADAQGNIEQTNNYYPFGALFCDGTGDDVQRYKYNGKELERLLALDWYDYGARWYDPVLARWHSVDPLAEKYPDVSPYVYCMNNPVNNIDPDGRKIVDAKGNVLISFYKGNIQYSRYANQDIRRVVNSMSMTKTGLNQLKKLVQSKTNIQIELINESKIEGSFVTYGETIQGNYNSFDNYGRKIQNGQYVLKSAKIKVYLGSIEEAVKEDSGLKYEGLTVNEALGSVMSHEAVHCTDINEIDKDIKYEIKNNKKARPDREILTNKIEKLIMEELKEQQ